MVLNVKGNAIPRSDSAGQTPVEAADSQRSRVLDAAEALFYSRGVQTVGMDDIRDAAGVSLKQLYRLFQGKEDLVVAALERRDVRWRQGLGAHVDRHQDPETRILAVFDWLEAWFAEPGFRGCAWINCYGELGAVSAPVTEQVRRHKREFRMYLGRLIAVAGLPTQLADSVALLAEGAMVAAGIFGTPSPASHARAAAQTLIGHAHGHRPGEDRDRP